MAVEPPSSPAPDVAPRVRPRWDDFAADLAAFRFDAIEASLRALCTARATRTTRQGGAQGAFLARVEALLRPALGSWYGWRDWVVTSEAFTRTARPSSRAAIEQLPNAGLGEVNARVDAAMRLLQQTIRTFVSFLHACAPGSDDHGAGGCATALADVLERFTPVVGPGWRRVAEDLAAWSLQARGLAVDEAALAAAAARLPDRALHAYAYRYDAAVALVAAGAGATREDFEAARPWVSRLYRPVARRAAEVREAVDGRRSARAAWEALATRGIIPAAWVDDPARAYALGGGAASPHPPTVSACELLASDVPNVLRAEALADEARARLRPWGLTASGARRWVFLRRQGRATTEPLKLAGVDTMAAIVCAVTGASFGEFFFPGDQAWQVALHDQWSWIRSMGLAEEAWDDDRVSAAAQELLARSSHRTSDHPTAEHALASRARMARCWSALRKTSLRLPTHAELATLEMPRPKAVLPAAPDGAPLRLADLADPFEPLLALWSLGYALRGSSRTPLALVALLA